MYSVSFSDQALSYLEAADPRDREQILACGDLLGTDPYRHPTILPLKGKLVGYFCIQIESLRLIYRIEEPAQEVIVLQIYLNSHHQVATLPANALRDP